MFKRTLFRLRTIFFLLTGPVTVPVAAVLVTLIGSDVVSLTIQSLKQLYSRNAIKAFRLGRLLEGRELE